MFADDALIDNFDVRESSELNNDHSVIDDLKIIYQRVHFLSKLYISLSPMSPLSVILFQPTSNSDLFSHSYPKKSPDFENDRHVGIAGMGSNHYYIGRWLPNVLRRLFYPSEWNKKTAIEDWAQDAKSEYIGYLLKRVNEIERENGKVETTIEDIKLKLKLKLANFDEIQSMESIINNSKLNGRKLRASQMPTNLECEICNHYNGVQLWDTNGEWWCIYQKAFEQLNLNCDKIEANGIIKVNDGILFNSFTLYKKWDVNLRKKIKLLERRGWESTDLCEFEKLNKELDHLKNESKIVNINTNLVIGLNG
ncbi:hypothetical protein DAMA08_016130 [Martiniozyma asiatica (nom. inval.)]|nr:hypothetical protein DAMA08_016130 [Martiniozyma asiatica]